MTRADIETMLHELAAAMRYLQDNGRLMREAADHLVEAGDQVRDAATKITTVSTRLQEMGERVEAAITAGLTHLHGDEGV